MFEHHREKRAAQIQEKAFDDWQTRRNGYAEMLSLAEHFSGTTSDALELKAGESLYYTIFNAALVEERRGPGHYQGGSTGVSVPVGSIGGHAVRYRVGANRGHYVQGTPHPEAVDTGNLYVTDQRIVFAGHRQTRECLFSKLISFQHDDGDGSTTFSVSNRQKAVTLHYGPDCSANFDFRLDLALAHHRGTVPQLIDELRRDLSTIDGQRPATPS